MTFLRFGMFVSAASLVACSSSGTAADAGNDVNTITDSSSPDVTQSADGGDAATTGCGAYTYCDDFESYTAGAIAYSAMLGPWKATVQGTGIQFQVDAVKPHAGKQSLHITVPAEPGQDAGTSARGTLNQTAASGLITGNNVFGRAMVFYSNMNGNDLPLGVHSWLFSSAGNSAIADGGVNMNMGGGGAKMQLNYHPPAPLPEQSVQGGVMSAGTWHCVQWEYDGSGAPPNDAGRVWVDGTLAVDVAKSQGWNFATPWNTFDFGFTHYQALANAVDVYLDDFALDGAMIPCPQ
jgi:hypothetical protein